jgi:hypothetical protein
MPVQRMKIVFRIIAAWMRGVQRQSHIIKVEFPRDEWQIISADVLLIIVACVPESVIII